MPEVTNTQDNIATGSLRWAIKEINDGRGTDIYFRVSGIISLEEDLPQIVRPVVIVNPNLEPLTIDGNKKIKYGLYWDEGALYSHVSGITVVNCKYGFYFYKNRGHVISSNTAKNNNIGFYLKDCNNNAFQSNTSENNLSIGFYLSNSNSNNFRLNVATNNKGFGYSITDNSSNNIFVNNHATINDGVGFQFYEHSDNNVFQNNIASENSFSGIAFKEFSNNNIINYNESSRNNAHGFEFVNSKGNRMFANQAIDNKLPGLVQDAASDNTTYNNNLIQKDGQTHYDVVEDLEKYLIIPKEIVEPEEVTQSESEEVVEHAETVEEVEDIDQLDEALEDEDKVQIDDALGEDKVQEEAFETVEEEVVTKQEEEVNNHSISIKRPQFDTGEDIVFMSSSTKIFPEVIKVGESSKPVIKKSMSDKQDFFLILEYDDSPEQVQSASKEKASDASLQKAKVDVKDNSIETFLETYEENSYLDNYFDDVFDFEEYQTYRMLEQSSNIILNTGYDSIFSKVTNRFSRFLVNTLI